MSHFFTVDVEDYFQVNAFERVVDRAEWDAFPGRVERSTERLLDLLNRKQAVGTFFTLGWVARKYPRLVRRITDAGHEVASHSWWHKRVTGLSPEEFREEVRSSRAILEDAGGQRVYGFRAPSFSIVPGREWALDILLEEGYAYDSSLFPIRRPDYGYPSANPDPHVWLRAAGRLLELPPATTTAFGLRVPAAGGGYFRQFPYAVTRRAFHQCELRGVPGMFYIHPWEVDPDQPRLSVPLVARLRHYTGLRRTLPRLERLLSEFRFTSVARHFGLAPNLAGPVDWPATLPA